MTERDERAGEVGQSAEIARPMCGVLVHGDPGAPCTKDPDHADWWHTHDSAQMPRTSPTPPATDPGVGVDGGGS